MKNLPEIPALWGNAEHRAFCGQGIDVPVNVPGCPPAGEVPLLAFWEQKDTGQVKPCLPGWELFVVPERCQTEVASPR